MPPPQLACMPVLYAPAGQLVQAVAAASPAYMPPGHVVHVIAPAPL